jgi:hypothetical protein
VLCELHARSDEGLRANPTGKHAVRGYDLERRDDRRRTPLHYAASHGHASVVALLLDHGANAYAVSDEGDASQVLPASSAHDTTRLALALALVYYAHLRSLSMQVAREAGHEEVAEMVKRYVERACPLLCMPVEVLLCVMEQLEPYDLCNVAQTCSVRTHTHHRTRTRTRTHARETEDGT